MADGRVIQQDSYKEGQEDHETMMTSESDQHRLHFSCFKSLKIIDQSKILIEHVGVDWKFKGTEHQLKTFQQQKFCLLFFYIFLSEKKFPRKLKDYDWELKDEKQADDDAFPSLVPLAL
jgi:hypothetical protein